MADEDLGHLWDALFDLADRLGAAPLNQHPGAFSTALADGYELHMNGHREPVTVMVDGCELNLPPFNGVIAKSGYICMAQFDAFSLTGIGLTSLEPMIAAVTKTAVRSPKEEAGGG